MLCAIFQVLNQNTIWMQMITWVGVPATVWLVVCRYRTNFCYIYNLDFQESCSVYDDITANYEHGEFPVPLYILLELCT